MTRISIVLFGLIFAVTISGYSDDNQKGTIPSRAIIGRVLDSELEVPLEYANVVLYEKDSKSQITGTITNQNGSFRMTGVKSGVYTLQVSFMGYTTTVIDTIEINPDQPGIDLGTIFLEQAVLIVDGVEVVAEKSPIEFKIDKKVINVSKYYTAVSGTAVDVLENVPSVTVDIEGNVSLRGSANFTVLIDGRPTVLEASDVLQQIPASTIENIEIITNPSAKYDPDGISGIINIITKRAELKGINGIVNLNAGFNEKYGGDFLLNHKQKKYQVYLGIDYNNNVYPGSFLTESYTITGDTTSFVYSDGDFYRGREHYGLRSGIDLYLSANDIWSINVRYGGMSMEHSSVLDFNEWTEPGDTRDLYISESSSERGRSFYSAVADYCHTFKKKEHEISGQVNFSRRHGDEESSNELLDTDGAITSGQTSTEQGPSTRLRAKLDYFRSLWGTDRFEIGYQCRISRNENITESYEYNPATGEYEFRSEFSHAVDYDRDIHSLYTLYSGELGSFGYQGGIRGEYTYRLIELIGENERFTIDRWDYFPSAHVSYEFPGHHQIMVNYARRIDRPRGWYLEPFETWSNAYNVRRGNPTLQPEYIDAYELGYQKNFGKSMFSFEAYHRITYNKVERVRSVYDANIILHTLENVGTDYTLGSEMMVAWDLFKWLSLNLTGNVYNYQIEGVLYGDSFTRESFNWSTRVNNTVKIGSLTRIQIIGMYNSPAVSSQGERAGFFITNVAFKQSFQGKKLSATIQVRDIFSTAQYDVISEGVDFHSHSEFNRKSPVFTLTIRYNFNNYKPERVRDERHEEFEDEEVF